MQVIIFIFYCSAAGLLRYHEITQWFRPIRVLCGAKGKGNRGVAYMCVPPLRLAWMVQYLQLYKNWRVCFPCLCSFIFKEVCCRLSRRVYRVLLIVGSFNHLPSIFLKVSAPSCQRGLIRWFCVTNYRVRQAG